MTVFGKILVFLNLLFSVLTGALIVIVFTTRANWQVAYQDAKKKAEAAEAAYKTERDSHDNDLKQKEEATKSLLAQIASLQNDIQSANQKVVDAETNRQAQEKLNVGSSTDAKRIQEELTQLKNERDTLAKEKDDLRKLVVAVQKDLDKNREIAIQEGLKAQTLIQKNSNLLRTVETLTVKIREMEQSGIAVGTGATGDAGSILNPPAKPAPQGVRGSVTAVGTKNNLAQISVGTDSGLTAGNVLTVYRDREYVGDLLITSTEAKAAVGKFTPAKRNNEIRVGDSVITSFSNVQ